MSRSSPAAVPRARPQAPLSTGILVVGGLVLLMLGGLLVFELGNWDKITPGVSALGTGVGGVGRAEAVSRLTPGVQQLLDRPLEIRGAGQTWKTTPRQLGLRLDPNELASAAYAIGREGSPSDRLGTHLDVLLHGRSVSPTSSTDQSALDASLSGIAQQIQRAPRNASLSLAKDGNVQAVGAEAGLAVDVPASREQITGALSTSGQTTVDLVTQSVPPAIPDEQVQTAHEQLDRLLGPDAQPLTLTFADKSFRLEHADIVKLVSLQGGTKPGQPAAVQLDETPLRTLAARIAKDIDQPVQKARFRFAGGGLTVTRPSTQGRQLDQAATITAIHDALLAGEHDLALPVAVAEPSVSSDNPAALGITELIERGSTAFAGSIPEKKHNIQLAAQRLSGAVVAPGATFSFNDAVGPTTLDAGFKWGFGITSGNDGPKTVPSVAGGICQVATTLFQPVFWAGYPLEERYWHLYWIPAYTSRGVVGLDVTVDSDAGIDFKWTNPTSDYILIQADADDEKVYFSLYGKKPAWKVAVDDVIITNRTPPDTKPIAQAEPTLPWGRTLTVETARDGFDAEVVRHVVPSDGSKPRELDLKSTYQPAHTVTLVGSAGKPANASIDDAIQHVLDAQKPAEAKASPTADAAKPDATPAAPTQAANTQATAAPKPAATIAPTAAPAKPQPTQQRGKPAPTATP